MASIQGIARYHCLFRSLLNYDTRDFHIRKPEDAHRADMRTLSEYDEWQPKRRFRRCSFTDAQGTRGNSCRTARCQRAIDAEHAGSVRHEGDPN